MASVFSGGAATAQTGQQYLVYEVYASGLHAVQAVLEMDTAAADRYAIRLGAHTRGFLGSVAPWEGTFETQGWREKHGGLQPETHRSQALWRGEGDEKVYRYDRAGRFVSLVNTEDGTDEPQSPGSELTEGTTDILSATLSVLQNVADGRACEGASDIFDGKRRYTQIFHPADPEELVASRYNIYAGPAQVCTVEVVPGAGAWHKKPRGWMSIQEQGRARGMMPTVWVAAMRPSLPAVPVKIRVKTAYGTLFMHLAEYRSDETVLIADKRER